MVVRQPRRARQAKWTVIGQQVPTFVRDMAAGRSRRPVLDGQVGRLRRGAAAALRAAAGDQSAESRSCCPATCTCTSAPISSSISPIRDRRRSVSSSPTRRSRPAATAATCPPTWEAIKGDNPHIKYHSARRGYIACTATPSTMRADFKILDRVTVPDLPTRTGGSLVVEAGRRGELHRLRSAIGDRAIADLTIADHPIAYFFNSSARRFESSRESSEERRHRRRISRVLLRDLPLGRRLFRRLAGLQLRPAPRSGSPG